MHRLRRILNNQGPDAARRVLEFIGPPGEDLRTHTKTCPECADLVRELYGDRDIPVSESYITPDLLNLLRESDEETNE